MKLIITSVLLSLGACGLAVAQSAPAPDPSQPATTAPSEQHSSTHSTDKKAQMKECVAQVQRSNPGMTERDIGDYCKKQLSDQTGAPH
ncbi:MAG: hypothetical protein JSR67_07425 [Proteobacteria bacterium]|nr:hypothetical protein [Pseudomonadota bacterium]